jgi:hypothetical protein
LTSDFRDDNAALQRHRAVLARDQADAHSNFTVGAILLDRGDDSGLVHLDQAMNADHEAILPACETAIAYLESRGRSDEAVRYRARVEQQLEVYGAASAEREEVDVTDELEPANLDPALVEQVRAAVANEQEAHKAYLVRKRLRHLSQEHPLYIVAVIPTKRWRQLWKEADAEEKDELTLADRVASALELPVDVQVIVPGPRSGMDDRLDAIEGAEIFSRD